MAYRFKPSEPFDEGARRILIEQIERAEKRLKAGEDRAAAVHEARKHFKRIRALLRLLRPAIGREAFRSENADFRETSALLAGARDAFVLRETLAWLEDLHGLDPARDTASLRAALDAMPEATAATASSAPVKSALRRLKAARLRIARLGIETDGFANIAAGLKRCYEEAQEARHAADAKGEDEAFHEWRKRVQQHWRHMALLTEGWPDFFTARLELARRLSATLGRDHDLAMLCQFLDGDHAGAIDADERRNIARRARASQQELRCSAAADADRLLADGAGGLARRVETYWQGAVRGTTGAGDRTESRAAKR